MDVDCPWCDGSGHGEDAGDEDRVTWATLDGEPVDSGLFDVAAALDAETAHKILNTRRQLAESLYLLECKPRGPLYWWPANR